MTGLAIGLVVVCVAGLGFNLYMRKKNKKD